MADDYDIKTLPTLKRGGPVTLDISWRPTFPEPFLSVFSTRFYGPADDPFLQKCRQAHDQGITERITIEDGRGRKVAANAYVTHLAEHQTPDGNLAWDLDFGVVSLVPPEGEASERKGDRSHDHL